MYVVHKKLLAAVLGAVMLLSLAGCFREAVTPPKKAVTLASAAQRVAYLQEQGWEIKETPIETLTMVLPEDLSEDWSDYCHLQSQQGLPFDQYGARQITRYTYAVTNYPDMEHGVQADLYLCDDILIGGDIIATGEDGFQQGLQFPEE